MKLLSAEFHLNLFTLPAWLKNKQQQKKPTCCSHWEIKWLGYSWDIRDNSLKECWEVKEAIMVMNYFYWSQIISWLKIQISFWVENYFSHYCVYARS